jgi:hypothetical protein
MNQMEKCGLPLVSVVSTSASCSLVLEVTTEPLEETPGMSTNWLVLSSHTTKSVSCKNILLILTILGNKVIADFNFSKEHCIVLLVSSRLEYLRILVLKH